MTNRFNMSDVMISYSRHDKDFVRQLEQALRAENLEIWVDWDDIAPTADWWQEIQAGIEAAHTFVFIITPASVQSEVCRREIDHALLHHKRLVPVLHIDLSEADKAQMHPALATHNWIYFREDDHFRRAFLMLRTALETDLDHKKLHTRLLVRSREWDERGHSASLLLRGDDLREAENWLVKAMGGQTPQPTERQIDYIRRSRRAAGRRTQTLVSALLGILLVLSVLLTGAFASSQQAAVQAQTAVYEISVRGTQEKIVIDSLGAAATAQSLEQTRSAEAQTAQARMVAAETQSARALSESGNSQTRAFVARQSALTATVLQGEAEALAQSAQAQQTQSGAAAAQAQRQVQLAQQQAAQAGTQAALIGTQVIVTSTAAVTVIAHAQTEAAISVEGALIAETDVNLAIVEGATQVAVLNAEQQVIVNEIATVVSAVQPLVEEVEALNLILTQSSLNPMTGAVYFNIQATYAYEAWPQLIALKHEGDQAVLAELIAPIMAELVQLCRDYAPSLSSEAYEICRQWVEPSLTPSEPVATLTPTPTPTATLTPTETAEPMLPEGEPAG